MQSRAIRNDPFLPQSQEKGQIPVFKIPLEYSLFSGRGEGGACCSPGTAEEELRLHDRSGDNDLKLLLDQLGEISSGDEPYERRALHKSERRAKNRARGEAAGGNRCGSICGNIRRALRVDAPCFFPSQTA